ncbi:hypothetical protein GA0115254_11177 [Streptomyces sp. Ncost-T10-10d]|nr:hypothetical protein GA0115254_11177 [Streptomyces sp. Ncost-T10-10d]
MRYPAPVSCAMYGTARAVGRQPLAVQLVKNSVICWATWSGWTSCTR